MSRHPNRALLAVSTMPPWARQSRLVVNMRGTRNTAQVWTRSADEAPAAELDRQMAGYLAAIDKKEGRDAACRWSRPTTAPTEPPRGRGISTVDRAANKPLRIRGPLINIQRPATISFIDTTRITHDRACRSGMGPRYRRPEVFEAAFTSRRSASGAGEAPEVARRDSPSVARRKVEKVARAIVCDVSSGFGAIECGASDR